MIFKDAVRQFFFYLKSNAHTPRTYNCYRDILENYPVQTIELDQVSPQDLQDHLAIFQHLAASSQNQIRSAFKSLFRWAMDYDLITKDPSRLTRLIKIPVKEARYLNAGEITKFREAIKTNPRDHLLFGMALQTGLRLAELHGLNMGDVRGKDSFLVVGKGKKTRAVYLNEALQSLICKSLNGHPDDCPLFTNYRGERLGRGAIQRLMKRYLSLAGLPLHFSPHSLRHTFATCCYDKTKDILLTSKLLGHASINTTAQVYAHISQEHMKQVAQNLF